MSENEPFIAVGCLSQGNEDGVHVRFRFNDQAGRIRDVILEKGNIPLLLAALQKETTDGTIVPIDPGSFRVGTDYRMQGLEYRRRDDGGVDLTLIVELLRQQRFVTIKASLPADVAIDLAQTILHHA